MKRVCTWCELVMDDGDGDLVTHGICPECFDRMMGEPISLVSLLILEQLKNP